MQQSGRLIIGQSQVNSRFFHFSFFFVFWGQSCMYFCLVGITFLKPVTPHRHQMPSPLAPLLPAEWHCYNSSLLVHQIIKFSLYKFTPFSTQTCYYFSHHIKTFSQLQSLYNLYLFLCSLYSKKKKSCKEFYLVSSILQLPFSLRLPLGCLCLTAIVLQCALFEVISDSLVAK